MITSKLKKLFYSTALIHFICVFPSLDQSKDIKLIERSLLGSQVKVLIPEDFHLMDEAMLKVKYPFERRPTIVYTNDRGSVNIALNHTQGTLTPNQLEGAFKDIEGSLRNLYPSAKWYRSEIIHRSGRKCFLLDFETPAIDTKIRNIMLSTILQNRLLIVSFNVTSKLERDWIQVGIKVIDSVYIIEDK